MTWLIPISSHFSRFTLGLRSRCLQPSGAPKTSNVEATPAVQQKDWRSSFGDQYSVARIFWTVRTSKMRDPTKLPFLPGRVPKQCPFKGCCSWVCHGLPSKSLQSNQMAWPIPNFVEFVGPCTDKWLHLFNCRYIHHESNLSILNLKTETSMGGGIAFFETTKWQTRKHDKECLWHLGMILPTLPIIFGSLPSLGRPGHTEWCWSAWQKCPTSKLAQAPSSRSCCTCQQSFPPLMALSTPMNMGTKTIPQLMASSTIQPPWHTLISSATSIQSCEKSRLQCLQCLLGSKCAPRRASMWQSLLALGNSSIPTSITSITSITSVTGATTCYNYHQLSLGRLQQLEKSQNSLRHPLAALFPRNHPRSLVPHHGSWVCPNMVVIHGYTLYQKSVFKNWVYQATQNHNHHLPL